MARFRLLVALALAGTALATPAASADSHELVLRGRTTAWVDVRVPGESHVTVTGSVERTGRFGGYLAVQRSSNLGDEYVGRWAGALVVRDFAATGAEPATVSLGTPQLTSGVIRFYLLADGPTTVRISAPPAEFASRTLTPRNRVSAAVGTGRLTARDGVWSRVAPVAVPRNPFGVVALIAEAQVVLGADTEACIGDRSADCPQPMLFRYGGEPADEAAPVETRMWALQYGPGALPAGRRYARHRVEHVTDVRRAVGMAFVVSLG